MDYQDRAAIAERISSVLNPDIRPDVWTKSNIIRVYLLKGKWGYISITPTGGADISNVKRQAYQAVKNILNSMDDIEVVL